jgi:hypothetical protein
MDMMVAAEAGFNHHTAVSGGVRADERGTLLSSFFSARRRSATRTIDAVN